MARKRNTDPNYKGFSNKRMNEVVYAERRQVMNHIYKAKNLLRANGIQMPRVEIRITEVDRHQTSAVGLARMNGFVIWIPADALKRFTEAQVYQIVLHELCHALWGIDHDTKCKLMHPSMRKATVPTFEKIFLAYAKKHGRVSEFAA